MKKYVIMLLIFLIMIISVSAVSAADDAADLGASDDATISVANTDTAITADGDAKNFTELNTLITGTTTGELTLGSDYKYNGTDDARTIAVDKNINIDGNGSTIDAVNGAIFVINEGKTVTLKNIILKNANGAAQSDVAILNSGTLTLDNVTFIDCHNSDSTAIYSQKGSLTVNNSAFEGSDYGIVAKDTAVYLFNNTIDSTKAIIKLTSASTLTSPSTVNVEASIDTADWKKIKYSAKVVDDNENNVYVDAGIWAVKINDEATTGFTAADGAISGENTATTYGTHVVSANNTALTNQEISTASVFVTPGIQDSVITFTYAPNPAQWNDSVTLTITVNNVTGDLGDLTPTGKVNLTITTLGNDPITLDLVNGSASHTIDNIAKGPWNFKIDYAGDDFFKENSTLEAFTVNPRQPEITIEVDNSTVGTQQITIILPSDAKGNVEATIGGTTYLPYTELTDGKASFTASLSPSVDPYTVNIKFYASTSENDNYTNTEVNLEFYAGKLTSNITIAVENITYGNNASFTITLAEGVDNATVVITKDDAPFDTLTVNLTDGSKTIDLGVIAVGVYNVTVKSIENGQYYSSTNTTLFNVSKATPNVEINVGEYTLFENVTVTVTVSNPENGTVYLYDGTVKVGENTTKNGVAVFNFTINTAGEHIIKAEFAPEDTENYTSTDSNDTINVDKLTPKITVNVDRVNIGQSANVEIIVEGAEGHTPTGSVIVEMGKFYNAKTLDIDGKANMVIDKQYLQTVDNYTMTVIYTFGTDVNYKNNRTTYTFEVTKWDVIYTIEVKDFTVNDDIVLNITVNDGVGCLSELTENFTVTIKDSNNETVNVTSVKLVDGVKTSLPYELASGVYTLEVSYAGDEGHYANSTVSDVFNVRKVITNLTVVVENVDYPNQAVAIVNASADGKYNVTVNNKNYTVEVADGIGNVTIDLLAPQTDAYPVTVVSIMDDYVVVTNNTSFKVNKGTINATFTIENVVYPNNATAYVTANLDGDYEITDGTNTIATVTVVNGTGNVTLDIIPVNTYNYKLIAPTNVNYTNSGAIVNSTQFNVTNGTIDITVTVDDVNYPNNATVIIEASAPGTYNVKVNGTDYTVTVDETGKGNRTIDVLIPNTYVVNVTAEIANYNPVKENTTFTVNKGNIQFSLVVPDVDYPNNATVTLVTDVVGQNKGYSIYVDGTKAANRVATINGNDTDKTFNLAVLPIGTHTVYVVPGPADPAFKYYNINVQTILNSTDFVVRAGAIDLTINVENPVYPAPAILNITTNVAGNYTVTVGSITKDVNLTAGENLVEIDGLTVNTYTATVTSKDPNYSTTTNSTNFVVTTGTIVASVSVADVPYLTQPVAVVTSTNANGTFTVNINGKDYAVEVVNGTGNVTIDDHLYVGNYKIKLTADIANYNPFMNDSASFNVIPAPVNLTIEIDNVTYPNQAVATVFANVSGVYNITVGGFSYEVAIETTTGVTANATQVIDLLGVKEYTADVNKVDSNNNFTAATGHATFNVVKGTPVIIINVLETYEVLKNVTINITVPYGTGQVQVLDGVTTIGSPVDLVNNTASVTIEKITGFGTHVIYVQLLNDVNFTNGINQTKFEVTKITPGFNITDNNAVYEDDVVITINLTGLVDGVDPNGQIVITGYGMKAATAGAIEFNLGKLAGGDYTLDITYTGDTKDAIYAGNTTQYSFTVKQFVPTVNASATGATYPDNATVTFISNRTGNFTIDIIDSEGNVQTIEVGIVANDTQTVKQIEGLTAGKYTANVTFIGNENYTAVTNTTEFTIEQAVATIEATVIPAAYPNKATVEVTATQNGTYTIKVIDSEGNVVDTQTGDLVANETASVELAQIAAGNYTVNVTYENANFTAEGVQKELTISKGVPTITIDATGVTYPETAIVNITSDVSGEYNVTVGTFNTIRTLTAGEVTTINLPLLGAKTYDIVVDFAGDDNYNATTETGSLTVAQGTPVITLIVDTEKILENANLTITIPYATGDSVKVNNETVELIDGVATYNIGVLTNQTYELTAIYNGDANLTYGDAYISFTVSKLPSNLVVTVENTTYGTDPKVTVTLDNKDALDVDLYVDGVYTKTVKILNGNYSETISDLHTGNHNVTVVYQGSDLYEAETQTAYFTIGKSNITLDVSAVGGTYPADVVVTVTSNVAGEYNLTVGTNTEVVTLEAGVAKELSFSGLAVGTYDVTLSRAESEDYYAVSKTVNATITKASVTITLVAGSVTYPNDVVATVKADVSGDYTVTLANTTEVVTLEANVAKEVKFPGLNAGNYEITAAYAENENYTAASETVNVAVSKANVTLAIAASDVTYPDTVVVIVTSNIAGNYTLALGTATPQTIALEKDVPSEIPFTNLSAGTYTFTVLCPETDNYNAADATTNVTVEKATITVNIVASDVTYPADVVVYVVADVDGKYNFTIGTTTEEIDLEAGVAKELKYPGLSAGTYDITVACAESENYAAVTQSANVTVNKVENTNITVEATSPVVGDNATVSVTLPADATGNVTVTLGNETYTAEVINGTASVTIPTDTVGNYTATVSYSGDDNYAPASSEVSIRVKVQGVIIAENIKRGVNSPYDYYATLVDADGNPVNGVELTFTINGKTYKATTNESGIATVSANLTLTDDKDTVYNVIVTNPYTLENSTATTTIVPRLIIVSGSLTADYLENPPYVVQAFGDDGNPVGAGETVRIVFGGFEYYLNTNATGHVIRTIGLAPGQYAVYAVYNGYKTKQTVFTVKQVLKVTSGTIKKTAKSYTLKATLKSSNGKAISGKEIKFTFNGNTYTAKTNSNGIASVTIKSADINKLKAGRTYELRAQYVNDLVKGKIKVVKK